MLYVHTSYTGSYKMDLIQENLPQCLPLNFDQCLDILMKKEGVHPRAFENFNRGLSAGLRFVEPLKCKMLIHTKADDVQGANITCDMEYLTLLIRMLDEITVWMQCHSELALAVPSVRFPVILDEIERLQRNPALFPTAPIRRDFFRSVHASLKAIRAQDRALQEWDAALLEVEDEASMNSQQLRLQKQGLLKETPYLPWKRIMPHVKQDFTVEEAKLAKQQREKLPVYLQMVPQGAVLILDHWRRVNERIISEILEVSHHVDRSAD